MKKFLLSSAVLFSAFAMNAEIKTVTYDFENNDYGLTRQTDNAGAYIDNGTKLTANDGTEITLTKTEDKNGWRLWKDGLRAYKNSNAGMTISTSTGAIKKIEFSAKENVISSISGVAVSGKTYGVACDGNNIPLSLTVDNNGAIYSITLTVDTEGTGTSTTVTAIEGGSEEPQATVVKSIAEILEVKDGTAIKVDFPMTVAFKSYSNVFACDAERNFIQLYGSNEYNVNDVIPAGWEGTYKLYSGTTPEILPATSFPAADGDNLFVPSVVDASAINVDMVNHVIAVADVVLAEASPADKANFTGVSNGTTLNLRNNYTLESVAAGKYNMTLLVQVYEGAPSLYVINYDADVNGSGVAEIETAEGVAEFYTLQGVKVANPENGLFIMVSGGKATKVLVK